MSGLLRGQGETDEVAFCHSLIDRSQRLLLDPTFQCCSWNPDRSANAHDRQLIPRDQLVSLRAPESQCAGHLFHPHQKLLHLFPSDPSGTAIDTCVILGIQYYEANHVVLQLRSNCVANMTEREKDLVQFFARLATIPAPTERMTEEEASRFEKRLKKKYDRERQGRRYGTTWQRAYARYEWKMSGFEALSKDEWRSLAQEFVKLSSYLKDSLAKVEVKQRSERSRASEKVITVKLATELDLPQLHRKVRFFLKGLFDGSKMPLAWLYQDEPEGPLTVKLSLENGRLYEGAVDSAPHERLVGDFVSVLRLTPFPFGRCPACQTVFVRIKRQRYCSRTCATRFIEAARKGQRREYMRDLMRKRRAMKLQRRQKGQ